LVRCDDAPYRGRARPCVERVLPHPNEWLVELEPFTVSTRLLTRPGTAREELLAAISGLVDERGEFRVTELLRSLNATHDRRRYWTLKRALLFMVDGGRGREPELERVRRGVYRSRRPPADPRN
jgi:hypothetical protein